jgi:hypothetical protein
MPGIEVRFRHTSYGGASYGPFAAVELLINELWIVTAAGDPVELLAEYDTQEGWWHVCDQGVEHERFSFVTIQSACGAEGSQEQSCLSKEKRL